MEFFFAVVILFIWLARGGHSYNNFRKIEQNKLSWKQLASATDMQFIPGSSFFDSAVVKGNYRGFRINVESPRKDGRGKITDRQTLIHISKLNNKLQGLEAISHIGKDGVSHVGFEGIRHLFGLEKSKLAQLDCTINMDSYNLQFREDSIRYNSTELKEIIDYLCDLAIAYPYVPLQGGEAVSFLLPIARNDRHPLQSTAKRLLLEVGSYTQSQFENKLDAIRCKTCLAYFKSHDINLGFLSSAQFYACRQCKLSRDYYDEKDLQLILVLDHQMKEDLIQNKNLIGINWFKRLSLVDFDEVEIGQASDEEVASFVLKVGNDTDPFRLERYKNMVCTLLTTSQLSENTLQMLRRIFGKVERQPTS